MIRKRLMLAVVVAVLGAVAASAARATTAPPSEFRGAAAYRPAGAADTSFFAYLTSPFYSSYSGSISVGAYASYRDYDCEPSYDCEHNVDVEFELRRGYGQYGLLLGRAYDSTGEYGSYANATFRVPTCKQLRRGTSTT